MSENIIDKFKNGINFGDNLTTSIYSGLKMIIENKYADYAILWFGDDKDKLSPYYWLCPYDLRKAKYNENDSVGLSYINNEMIIKNKDTTIKNFIKEEITSNICLPLSANKKTFGVLEFISKKDEFSDDIINTFKTIASVICQAFEKNDILINKNEDKELLLSIKDLYKTYDNSIIKNKVLKGINIDIYKGEFLCILGESGCGKSTLLNIIGGLIDADKGSLLFNGREILKLSEKELTEHRKNNIGYIFQSYNLMPNLTAKQNLDLIKELINESESSVNMLKLVGMENKINSYPSELSGGEQQRVSIARALVKKPILILADEPTAALDCETSRGVLEVFEKVVKNGQTLIVVTHNEKITKIANRVIRLKDGKIYETSININPMKAKELEW